MRLLVRVVCKVIITVVFSPTFPGAYVSDCFNRTTKEVDSCKKLIKELWEE